jgi:membrane protease YdiL (CAAX protease family)
MFEEMKTRYFIGLLFLWLVSFGIAAIFFPYTDDFAEAGLTAILYVVVPLIFFSYYFRKQGIKVREVVFRKGSGSWLPSLVGLVVVCIAFSLSVFWLQLYALMPISPGLVDFFLEPITLPESPIYLTITIISIALIGPIAEEFIFRGMLLHRMMKKTSMWGGILISSILFGILHADIIGATIFGIIASLLYLKTGNLLIPILLHIFNNSLAIILGFVAPSWPSWAIAEKSDIYTYILPNTIVLSISSMLMIWVVVRLTKGLKRKLSDDEVSELA